MKPSGEELWTVVATRYDLPDVVSEQRFGLWGETLRASLKTSDGATYYLKERSYLDRREFGLVIALQESAAAECEAIQQVHRTRAGALWFTHENRDFALYEFIEADPEPVARQDAIVSFGGVLRALAKVEAPHHGDWNIPKVRARYFPDHPRLLPPYLTNFATPAGTDPAALSVRSRALAKQITDQVRDSIERIDWQDLPAQFLHGDPSPFHALAQAGRPRWIDFEDAHWGYRCWDVARMIVSCLCLQHASEDAPVAFAEAWPADALGEAVAAYGEQHTFTNAERLALPALLPVVLAATAVSELDLDDPDISLPPDLPAHYERVLALVSSRPEL